MPSGAFFTRSDLDLDQRMTWMFGSKSVVYKTGSSTLSVSKMFTVMNNFLAIVLVSKTKQNK